MEPEASPSSASEAHGAALARLLARPRFEVFPTASVDEATRHLPHGATVAVSCSPTRGIEATLALSERLAGQGFRPVPHLSARLVGDRGHLTGIVERLARAGLREIFVIGGDVPKPAGPFASALDLLQALAAAGHDLERIGVAAYPDGHPLLNEETLVDALRAKQPLADYMVTQLCFDPERIASWIARARRRGIHLPVLVGLPGAVQRRKLLRFSLRIGVGDSARLLAKHAGLAARLVQSADYRPDHLLAGLARWVGVPDYQVQVLHLYTFNEVERTEQWRRQLLAEHRGGSSAHTV